MPSIFPFFFVFFKKLSNNKRWHQWDAGAADSGFVGMLVRRSKWKQHQMDKRPLRLICFEDEAALMYRPIAGRLVQKEGTTSLMRRVRPLIQQCFHYRATDVLVWKVRGIYLALQLFFPSKLLRFDFNAFLCSFVFSCKNLTVLECLYFIKCV